MRMYDPAPRLPRPSKTAHVGFLDKGTLQSLPNTAAGAVKKEWSIFNAGCPTCGAKLTSHTMNGAHETWRYECIGTITKTELSYESVRKCRAPYSKIIALANSVFTHNKDCACDYCIALRGVNKDWESYLDTIKKEAEALQDIIKQKDAEIEKLKRKPPPQLVPDAAIGGALKRAFKGAMDTRPVIRTEHIPPRGK